MSRHSNLYRKLRRDSTDTAKKTAKLRRDSCRDSAKTSQKFERFQKDSKRLAEISPKLADSTHQ